MRHIQGHYNQIKGKRFSNFSIKRRKKIKIRPWSFRQTLIPFIKTLTTKFLKGNAASIGALDNASSLVSLLELIKVIEHVELPFNVIVAFFDLQELGNLGAYAFVQEALDRSKGKEIIHLNALMIGKTHFSKMKNVLRFMELSS